MRFVPWSQDHWLTNDKFAHLGMWFTLTCCLFRTELSILGTVLIGVAWGIFWELCDGENVFVWNDPRGFSWKDLVVDCIGIAGAIVIWS